MITRFFWRLHRLFLGAALMFYGAEEANTQSPLAVTLLSSTSPTAGEPGVTNLSVTGSNFPTGTIPAANVTVTLTPQSGGVAVTTKASAVATVAGTTRRVSFTIPASVSVPAPDPYAVTISGTSSTGTPFQSSNSALLTVNPVASISTLVPNSGQTAQSLSVAITGLFSNFLQGSTVANFGAGITITSIQVTNATHATIGITIAGGATAGARTVTMTTGAEVATLGSGFTVTAVGGTPVITDFNPKSAPVGALITVSGTNLQPNAGTAVQFVLPQQGGGTLTGFATTANATSVTFVVPAGAATGIPSVTVNSQNASAATALTIVPSSSFTVNAAPSAANLIQGQSVGIAVSLTGTGGFDALAALSVSGVPSGVTAAFKPQSITAGQTSLLTLTAPSNQPIATSPLMITAASTASGLPVTQIANASVSVMAPTTSFIGRTVVSDSLETPLAGVTITMLGKDGNGDTTGCTGGGVSDAGGNFALTSLPPTCVGPQLVGFNGTTATSPQGTYAGVNLVFTFIAGQVTASPVLVHLPRIDNVETFLVTQNSSSNQTHVFTSIPGLSVAVYAGTTFTMPDGTTPNPFPLAAVQVPLDRLPDSKPTVPTMMMVFIVAFQPANATASQPVAVTYPNPINTAPGTDMALMTLDPTHGQMVPYGTGAVSSDGTQIVPDPDPAHPGHLYGLVHFDWHGPMPPPASTIDPSPAGGGTGSGNGGNCSDTNNNDDGDPPCDDPCLCQLGGDPQAGEPIDLASGLYVSNVTDMVLSGTRGRVAIHRIYRTLSTNDGPFGVGSSFNYDYQLDVAGVSSAGVVNLINPDGSRFPLSRENSGALVNATIPRMQGTVMTTGPGDQANLRYKNGTVVVFQRFGLLSLEVSVTDANGNQISINRNPGNPQQILSISDPVGRQLTFQYDTQNANHIASITDPTGRVVTYTYFGSGNLATVTDPAGGVTKYFYDTSNRVTSMIDARATTVFQNTYDANGRVSRQTLANGNVITVGYELANPTAQTSFIRDVTTTDSLGRGYFYRFNPEGFVIQANDILGQTTVFNRDPGTNLVLSTTGNANCPVCAPSSIGGLSFTYDANGNPLTKTDALGNTTTFTYEPIFSKVTSVTDPLGKVTRFTYDAAGNLLTQTDANGNQTSFQYNPSGLLLQATDALNQTTKFAYDSFGNPTSVTDPLNNVTSYVYDAVSRLVENTDALGRRTDFTYDALNRLSTRTDAKLGVTQFGYDANGNLLSVKDAKNNATGFTYDVMNRVSTRTNPLGSIDSRTYDQEGNLVGFVDRRGQSSTFTYDALNRLTAETYQDASVTRIYDASSRLTQVTDSASGVFTFSYDQAGRLTGSSTPMGALNYTYDGRGLMTSRQVVGQPTLSYSYDPAGNLAAATLPQASASFTYNARNQLSKISRQNGVSSVFGYDPDARLLTVTHAAGANMIDAESYMYDAVGNRAGHSTNIGQSPITQPTANQYNANNELTLFGSVPDTYDANGNLVQEGNSTSYTWDGRNRLRSIVTAAGQTTNFIYDFAGNMMAQADSGTSLNLTKTFVMDSLTNVAYEAGSDGTSYSVLSGRSIDSHLAIAQSTGQVQYGLTDAINSTVVTTDQSGAIKSLLLYDPFGQTTTTSSYPFQFTGRMAVSTTAYYYRARFYNTQTGRFISEDPLGFGGGDPNLYRYASNAPTLRTDPTGLDTNLVCYIVQGILVCVQVTVGVPIPPGRGKIKLPPEPTPIEQPLPGPGGQQEPPPPEGPIPIPSPSFCPTPIRPPTLSPFPIWSPIGPSFHP